MSVLNFVENCLIFVLCVAQKAKQGSSVIRKNDFRRIIIMLKHEDKVLIRTALMEYRYLLFKTYHGTEDEKEQIAHVNKVLQGWKV